MRNFKLGVGLLLSGAVFFSATTAALAATRQVATVGDNVVLPPTLTSPENGERVSQPLVKLVGSTEAKYKITVKVDGKQQKFRGRKYLTADKNGIFEALLALKEGSKDDVRTIAVYAVNAETGKMSQATEVIVVLNDDMLLTQYHGRVGYCDSEGNFLRAPESKKMYTYRMALGITAVLAASGHGGAAAMVPAGSININSQGEYKANLHKAAGSYIALLGVPYSAIKVLEADKMFEGMMFIDMTEDLDKDLGLFCLGEDI